MKKIVIISLILFICLAAFVSADNAEAKNNLVKFANALSARYGLKAIPGTSGQVFTIKEKQYIEIKRTLQAGVKYFIIGAGDRYAKNVNIALFDGNMNVIGTDVKPDPAAVVSVTPRWTGSFYIRVQLWQGAGGFASVGYIIMYAP